MVSTKPWSIIEGCYSPNRKVASNWPTTTLTQENSLNRRPAYPFADEAYAKLLANVSGKPVSAELRSDILVYYADLGAPFETKKDPKASQNVLDELGKLRALPVTGASE